MIEKRLPTWPMLTDTQKFMVKRIENVLSYMDTDRYWYWLIGKSPERAPATRLQLIVSGEDYYVLEEARSLREVFDELDIA